MKQQRMNFRILAVLLTALMVLLAGFGAYSVVTYGNRWFSSNRNPRVRAQKETVLAGDILDRNGVTLATTTEDGKRIYQADAAARSAVVHLIGDPQGQVSNSVETFQTNYLYGFQLSLGEMIDTMGQQRRGDSVMLTIDSRLCTEIVRYFSQNSDTAGKNGAAVVMNYKTGEMIAEVSLPGFDPMNITAETLANPGHPFWNRVTQAVYPPGSTFKIVTAAAALENIEGVESMDFTCAGGLAVDAVHVIYDYAGSKHGDLSLRDAFKVSCNNTFASLALHHIGDRQLRTAAELFGFNDNFLFRDLVVENSAYPTENRTPYEVAMSGIGQSAIVASPMHMCMVAAAIANDGMMMEPRLLRSVDSVSGVNRATYQSNVYRKALSADTARKVGQYMDAVVASGSGRRADVSELAICGKTGTAESTSGSRAINYGWFVGYIDDDALPFAVCVLVEDIPDGESGGTTAAPVAGQIFTYLRNHPEMVTD